ncbi:protein mab-21-like 3 [Saccoglossus kowalevskii]
MKEIDKDGGCRKECLRILKKLREDNRCCPPNKPALASFHLKILLFWQCETYPDSREWDRCRLPERIMRMVAKLKQWLDDRICPHYFINGVNLFADKSGKLKDHDGLLLTATEVGKFLAFPNNFFE